MPPRRRGPVRSTRASAIKAPTPPELTDEELPDAPSGTTTPVEPTATNDDEEPDYEDDGQQASSPVVEDRPTVSRTRSTRRSEAAAAKEVKEVKEIKKDVEAESTPTPTPVPFKRGPGRPPKHRPVDLDGSEVVSDSTPKRRGGFRGRSFGGGRWKNRSGSQRVTQVPVDNEGNMATVRDDEVDLPEDAEGEEKVDKLGQLKGGREYRVRTFTIGGRGERLYMLSTEPARCIGFRDSYLFFQKHKQLFKIIINDEEKRDLIDRDLMPHSYKGRTIGVVTARSVFREFGAQIIIGGKRIFDDYRVTAARAEGVTEGEVAVPGDILPLPGQEYNRNQYVAWHGASAVYHSGVPTVPMASGKEKMKRAVALNDTNWQYEHAMAAVRYNSQLAATRRANLEAGYYDIHTNKPMFPANTQPTHARWEAVEATEDLSEGLAGLELKKNQSKINGQGENDKVTSVNSTDSKPDQTLFPSVSGFQRRNMATVDVVYVNPADYHRGTSDSPGPQGIPRPYHSKLGMLSVPDDVADLLPPDCRKAFDEQQERERKWLAQFNNGEDSEDQDLRHIVGRDPIHDNLYNPNAI